MIHFTCSGCQGNNVVAEGYAGEHIRCRHCGVVVRVPAQKEREGSTAAVRVASGDSATGRNGIRFRCPHCYQKHRVSEACTGRWVRCANCGQGIGVPPPDTSGTLPGLAADATATESESPAPPVLPSMESYYRSVRDSQVIRRTIWAAAAVLVVFVAVLLAKSWIDGWIEGRQIAALDGQVAAAIEQAERAAAEANFQRAQASLEDAWEAIETSGLPFYKIKDLGVRVSKAIESVSKAKELAQAEPTSELAGSASSARSE